MIDSVSAGRFLEPNEIARRFGNRPGFQLIDFTQVALPIFVIPIDAIVISSKPLLLVDEFLLRSITERVDTLPDLSGFLGLDSAFVAKRLAELVGLDLLSYAPDEDGRARAGLTQKGKDAVKKAMVVQPKRESFNIAIDGITRRPLSSRPRGMLAVRDVRTFGLVEIRAFPEDKAPEFSEIAQMDLTAAVSSGSKRERQVERVMSLVHMGTRLRRYREATMLVFRAERGSQIHVEFFIDGRPSTALSEAFARYDGVKALHIPEQTEASIAQTETELKTVFPDLIGSELSQQIVADRPKLQTSISTVGLLESRIEEKEISIDEAGSRDEVERLKAEVAKLQGEKAQVEEELNSLEMRYVEVHEHRPMFERSLIEARHRILIVSPWIRDSVLTSYRLRKLSDLVERGVEVFIAYGLGADEKQGKDKGEQAIRLLNHLSDRYPNLHFREFGDTHAKILLVDDSFAVIGSFNWLSFEGSSRRDFREEMSFRINKKTEIERLFQRYFERFQDNGDGSTNTPPSKFTNSPVVPELERAFTPSNASPPAVTARSTAPNELGHKKAQNLRPPPAAPADPNIISLKQFADELRRPLSEVLQTLKKTFPYLVEGAKVNRTALLQQWKQLTEKPQNFAPAASQVTRALEPRKTEFAQKPRPGPLAVPKPQAPQASNKSQAETVPAKPKAPPSPAKPQAVSRQNVVQPVRTAAIRASQPIPISLLANHLGISVEKIVDDLGWGRLSRADCVVAYEHVVRLCHQHNRPIPTQFW